MSSNEDRYILASELPGVLTDVPLRCEHRKACWSGDDWYDSVYCDGALVHENGDVSDPFDYLIRLDLTLPEVQHHLCLTYGPRVDGRPRIYCLTTRDYWLSLLGNPAAIAAECRAVVAAMERHDQPE